MLEVIDGVLGAFGLKLKVLLAGAVGSFISLRFFDGLHVAEKWTTFFGGAMLAGYLTAPFFVYMELKSQELVPGVSLLIGLFGMSLTAAVIRVIKGTDWGALIKRKAGGE